MKSPNFAFLGTPEVASKTLEILKVDGLLPSLIVTAPDKPKGRKMLLTPPPVKQWAIENNVPYFQSEDKSELLSEIKKWHQKNPFDFFLVVAYGKILPEEFIKLPKLGSINIHYSLLPKYRGASPVETAILKGETKTGITIQQMEYKMDSGAILAQETVNVLPEETAPELKERLIKIGGDILLKILPDFLAQKIIPIFQKEEEATFCTKIKKEAGLIDLTADPIKNYNKFRAYVQWPRTFFFENGKRIIITEAKLENGKFKIKKIIPEGGKEKTVTSR